MIKLLYLSQEQWDRRIKTIASKNLKEYHRTPYWLSVGYAMHDCIVEIYDGTLVVDEEKYKELKKICRSEKYALGIK
jgi:hypothetical protein